MFVAKMVGVDLGEGFLVKSLLHYVCPW